MRIPSFAVGILLLLSGCRAATPPAAPPAARPPVMDGLVDIGGTSLHIHCIGDGSPLVVLEAGLGNDGATWGDVPPGVAAFTRACVSDRAGMGYSSGPAKKPHTNRQMAQELHTLLQRAGHAPPYILVGHSMGGANIRLFVSEHPHEVQGMVLVDSVGDEWPTRYVEAWSAAMRAAFPKMMTELHEGLDFDTFRAGITDAATSNRTLGDVPLIVLSRGKEDPTPDVSPVVQANMHGVWVDMETKLVGLSSNSAHVVAVNSGHNIQWDAPKLVIAAVHEVVTAVRTHGRVDARPLVPFASDGDR